MLLHYWMLHLALRCWMSLASQLMADIARLLGKDASLYQETAAYLQDNALLDQLHWSDVSGEMCILL